MISVKNKRGPQRKRKVRSKFSSNELGEVEDMDDPGPCCYQCGKAGYLNTNFGHHSTDGKKCTCYRIQSRDWKLENAGDDWHGLRCKATKSSRGRRKRNSGKYILLKLGEVVQIHVFLAIRARPIIGHTNVFSCYQLIDID